jgi:ribosomal protein S18 acetylase RimI-like enzyme
LERESRKPIFPSKRIAIRLDGPAAQGKAFDVIQYRTFRNTDPPALVDLWNACFTGRGAAHLRGTILLEYFTFAKPYFDPAGLILACADGQAVGFALSGFGPDAAQKALDKSKGVLSEIGVVPTFRKQGIGTELLARSEAYLRGRGAKEIFAGPIPGLNPYLFGIYGGCSSTGFLESDQAARPFFEHHDYHRQATILVMDRPLDAPLSIADGRFPAFRQRFEIFALPLRPMTWWQDCVAGPIELHEYRLQDKATNEVAAKMTLWHMETFAQRWNDHAVGLVELDVLPALRRQGLAKFFLVQILRHLQEQFFTLIEIPVREGNEAALNLFRGFGFKEVDKGHCFRRADLPATP